VLFILAMVVLADVSIRAVSRRPRPATA